MDKILEALVTSSHPLPVKRAIVRKVVDAAEREVTEEQCHALYTLTTRLILQGEDAFQRQTGQQVQESYARYHREEFASFFTKDFVLGLLQQGYGPLDRRDPLIIDYLHGCLRLLISCPAVLEVAAVLRTEVLRVVCERPEPTLCARLATLLIDFPQCVPREKSQGGLFCQQLVRTMSHFHCTANEEKELREYVAHVNLVSTLLQGIWKSDPAALLPSLQEVFSIISSTDPTFEPSISLASLVQHIPLQMITVLIKSLTTDQNVKDANMTKALCRMIDWLSWPLANHVNAWVIALLKGLAAVQKFTILIDVTLLKIELVFNRLWYPIVRQGALMVLSHMLLSFQHSPEAFHLVVPHVVKLVQSLRSDGLPTSEAFLLQFTELIHCMMYQYSGFPDLYDTILEAIKDLPKPGEEKIKLVLNQSAWTSQSNLFAPGLLPLTGKSETGKTGLVNLGNTCYMNSVIQTLFMATDFRRHVLSLQLKGTNTLMKKLQLLFAFLAHTQRAAYAPRNFFEASRPPWFTIGSQQDCSEYLRFLLDRLHEEEKTMRDLAEAKTKPADVAPCEQPTAGITPTIPDPSSGDSRTLVERMFGGRLTTGIRCLRCHSVSEKEEPFTDLSLAFCPPNTHSKASPRRGAVNGGAESPVVVMGPVTQDGVGPSGVEVPVVHYGQPLELQDLVDYMLAPEILEEENSYLCECCGSLQRAERSVRVVAAPDYLILTLLRFSYDAARQLRQKISDDVRVPLRMCLPVHQTQSAQHTSQLGAAASSTCCTLTATHSPDGEENQAKKLKPSQGEDIGCEARRETEEVVKKTAKRDRNPGGVALDKQGDGLECRSELRTYPYVLTSVVMHSGISSESGHYYTYGRNMSSMDYEESNTSTNQNSPLNGELGKVDTSSQSEMSSCSNRVESSNDPLTNDWVLFNDSRVTFTTFNSVQNVTRRFSKDTAYVLIYRRQGSGNGSHGNEGAATNGLRLGIEPPLQKELMDAITKDNKLYLQEQELNARTRALQAASASCSFRPNGSDDNEPPGSCGPSGGGGGGGGGFNTVSRLVF